MVQAFATAGAKHIVISGRRENLLEETAKKVNLALLNFHLIYTQSRITPNLTFPDRPILLINQNPCPQSRHLLGKRRRRPLRRNPQIRRPGRHPRCERRLSILSWPHQRLRPIRLVAILRNQHKRHLPPRSGLGLSIPCFQVPKSRLHQPQHRRRSHRPSIRADVCVQWLEASGSHGSRLSPGREP
jgi:hypothetical protein